MLTDHWVRTFFLHYCGHGLVNFTQHNTTVYWHQICLFIQWLTPLKWTLQISSLPSSKALLSHPLLLIPSESSSSRSKTDHCTRCVQLVFTSRISGTTGRTRLSVFFGSPSSCSHHTPLTTDYSPGAAVRAITVGLAGMLWHSLGVIPSNLLTGHRQGTHTRPK